jgi:F0F1-type ATP synthase membrane subunit b/b'
VATTRRA